MDTNFTILKHVMNSSGSDLYLMNKSHNFSDKSSYNALQCRPTPCFACLITIFQTVKMQVFKCAHFLFYFLPRYQLKWRNLNNELITRIYFIVPCSTRPSNALTRCFHESEMCYHGDGKYFPIKIQAYVCTNTFLFVKNLMYYPKYYTFTIIMLCKRTKIVHFSIW